MTTSPNPDSRDWAKITAVAAAVIAWLLLLFMLSSCMTIDRAQMYLEKKDALAEICATKYPVQTERQTAGKVIEKHDTTVMQGPVIPCPDKPADSIIKTVKVQCPPSYMIRDSFFVHDSFYIRSDAAVAAKDAQISNLVKQNAIISADRDKFKSGRKWWRTSALITWGIIAAFGAGFVLSKTMKIPI